MATQLVEARPKTASEWALQGPHPEVEQAARRRGITDVVHFTTLRGVVGVLASGALKSRARLPSDQYLEHVYRPNAELRKDRAWLDYVNLSIQRINDWMFGTSTRWHAADDNPWVLLSFDVAVLSHPGVVFATTNNIYPSCLRAEGPGGFSRLFDAEVEGRYGQLHSREGKRESWPTDRQAEVLYPGELSCEHLRRVDVQMVKTEDAVHGALSGLGMDVPMRIRHAPEVFQ